MANGIFSFLKGDDLWSILEDAAKYTREHGKRTVITYGKYRYEIHPDNTSEEALQWLMGEMQKDVAASGSVPTPK